MGSRWIHFWVGAFIAVAVNIFNRGLSFPLSFFLFFFTRFNNLDKEIGMSVVSVIQDLSKNVLHDFPDPFLKYVFEPIKCGSGLPQ